MIIRLFVFSSLFLASVGAWSQSAKKNEFMVLEQTKRYLTEENWEGAAFAATKVLVVNPDHPQIAFYGAIGNINAKNYAAGLDLLNRIQPASAKKLKDLSFWKGRAFMGLNFPDSALTYLSRYKKSGGKLPAHSFGFSVDYYMSQCTIAQKCMAAPVNAVFKNMGEKVNDDDDDVAPSLTAEGDILIFTSRRNSNIGGQDDPFDGRPFQDIWMSRLDTLTGKWGEAENLTKLNSPTHEANMSISPDGNTVFIYKNITDKTGSGDIWYAKTKGDPTDWSRPKEFEGAFNSSYFETSAALAPGGKVLYFVSERPDGKPSFGNGDVWMCERLNRREWKKPLNLGALVNTAFDEISVSVHPNGRTLFFASNSDKSMGGYDIFRTEYVNGKWTEPVNLGYPINTMGDEIHFTVSADGKKAFMAAIRPEGLGRYDIYEVDLSNYRITDNEASAEQNGVSGSGEVLSVLKGKIINGSSGTDGAEATLTVFDAETDAEVAKTDSDENGDYFLTLPGGKKYEVTIEAEGFKTQQDQFYLGKRAGSIPFVLAKSYFLQPQ